MATAFLINKLIGMLANMIIEDVNWACSFKDDFKLLCENLSALEGLLTELGERWHSASVSKWIESLEDFVEDGIVIVERCQEQNKKGGNRLLRYPLFFLRTAKELKSLKKKLERLDSDAKYLKYLTYASTLDANAPTLIIPADRRERSSSFFKESEIKTDEEKETIATLSKVLTTTWSGLMLLIGMGGLGKTFYAQRLFHSACSDFGCAVWLAVSPSYSTKKLLFDARSQVNSYQSGARAITLMDIVEDQVQPLRNLVANKRLLLVLDDVWQDDVLAQINFNQWKPASYKVIITRQLRTLDFGGEHNFIHYITHLKMESSLSWFNYYAFPHSEMNKSPKALVPIAKCLANRPGWTEWSSRFQGRQGSSALCEIKL